MPEIIRLTPEERKKREQKRKEQEEIEHKQIEKYGRHYETNEDYIKKYVSDSKVKNKSPTKKEVKKLMKEVEAEVIPPKIKTGKVKKLLKTVENILFLNKLQINIE